jgi:hypothetical protein
MSSNWALPLTVSQYAETGFENNHISWAEDRNFAAIKNKDGTHIKTSRDLLHIARDPRHDILDTTYFLKCTDFNFQNLPVTISGFEIKLTMNRFGRITDDTIQLILNDDLIGQNQATLALDPIKIYGSSNDLLGSALTSSISLNSTFGVVLRFRSHPSWPHKCSALIDAVEIRIH